MFTLSKIFLLLFSPMNIVLFVLTLGAALLFTRFRRTGRLFVLTATALLLLVSVFPVGDWFIEKLENRFPTNPAISSDITGIIVLGGTINQYITSARGQPSLTTGGERLTEFIFLARQFPQAKLIFTGGSGSLFNQNLKEADAARLFFDQMGLKSDRIIYETNSRNTLENAVNSRELAADSANGKWLLVTSAVHMPRAMGVFRKAGWNVLAYPVDYFTDGRGSFQLGFSPLGGLYSVSRAIHEWIGLFAYRVMGRTSNFFPSPEPVPDN